LSTAQLMAGTQLTTMMIVAGMQAMMLPPAIPMARKDDRFPNEKQQSGRRAQQAHPEGQRASSLAIVHFTPQEGADNEYPRRKAPNQEQAA
jgi:hypothetical protein